MMFHTKSPGRRTGSHEDSPSRRVSSRGFTLIELMVTVAIVGILATIAVASYQYEIQKSRRTDARSALMDLAGREEKLFSVTNAYSPNASDLGYPAFTTAVGSGYYTVAVTVDNAATPPSYLIIATAIGSQASDSACKTLTVDQTGVQGSTGSGTAATCWGN
jgi:type IV pilus assembly protein PilE